LDIKSGFTHWEALNEGATNETGFTALPGGYRYGVDGSFEHIRSVGYWWTSSSSVDEKFARRVIISCKGEYAIVGGFSKQTGYSVRCVKDN